MNGQWIGRYSGSASGKLVIELDDRGTFYEGWVYAYDDDPERPGTCAPFKTSNKLEQFSIRLPLFGISKLSGCCEPAQVEKDYPNVRFSKHADVTIQKQADELAVSWTTDLGVNGSATVARGYPDRESELKPLAAVSDWVSFKKYANSLDPGHYIFRGQNCIKRLRTAFHRTGRADLVRFRNTDILTLHRHLSSRTRHLFDLSIPDHNGAFLNLVQHHGYPTPLLDWTRSPYVAAFFAYRNIDSARALAAKDDKKVRIFLFDSDRWSSDYPQFKFLTGPPHFSVMEFIAINNERMVPQQSISSVSTVDDIEGYIRSLEKANSPYLQVIDLPMNERQLVMRELSIMGITAGSLFPGLDGACEELRERFF